VTIKLLKNHAIYVSIYCYICNYAVRKKYRVSIFTSNKPLTWDGTVAAQKALSCVYRTGQRFGVNYLIDVLTGKDDERIRHHRHDQITPFGLGIEHSAPEWRSIFRQLIAQGHLDVELGRAFLAWLGAVNTGQGAQAGSMRMSR
jgi:superfamily II DNA helicase RecQ